LRGAQKLRSSVGQREARVELRGFVGDGQQIRGERGAACVAAVVAGREIVGETVLVEIDGHARQHALPARRIAQAERNRRLLFEAAIRIALEPAAHARHAVRQLRLQRHCDAAAQRARLCRRRVRRRGDG
jgi:hypothetical protein